MSELELNSFTTCEISDALLKLGSPHGGHIPDIYLYSPAQPDPNFRIYGPAFTVQAVHYTDQIAPWMKLLPVDYAPSKCIAVMDLPIHTKNAAWGGVMTATGRAKGLIGAVLSGRTRDLAEHHAADFPVFARGQSTVGHTPFTRATAVNVPIVIEPRDNVRGPDAFPAVTVEPGDWIVGDIDGVVCVPKDMIDKVVELAKGGREVDAKILEDIKTGKGVQASFKLHIGR